MMQMNFSSSGSSITVHTAHEQTSHPRCNTLWYTLVSLNFKQLSTATF